MRAYVPVRAPRVAAGPRGALVPVRLDPLVSVPDKNRDEWASLLAHIHWSRFVAGTGTKGWSLVPVPETNRDQRFRYIYPSPANRALHCSVFSWSARRGLCGALAHLLCT